jgi:hypothetical protein
MSLSNKTFKNNATGEIVKVIDSFENIAVLENKGKAEVSKLLNTDLYTEQIDVSSFFNTQGAYNNLAEKIKNIPADKIRDDVGGEVMINVDGNNSFSSVKPSMDESAIVMTTEEDERAELARKYGVVTPQNDVDKQNQAFAKLLGEEEEVQTIEVNREQPRVETQRPVQQPVQMAEDPIITMFKNVKRSKDFSISLEIKNKIPRPDFIEMMEDSYNTSIIDFLAAEFTDNLLRNPQIIEDMIKQKIKEVVYGAEVEVKDVNSQITDSVTQVKHEPISIEKESVLSKDIETPKKPTTTRKPRPNTTQGEKANGKPTRAKKETSK